MTNKQYNKYIENRAHRSKCLINCIKAFFVGGIICLIGELFLELYKYLGASNDNSRIFSSMSLILIAGILTGVGVFDKIAKFGGAGALVPITGFANSMVSPAIESKTEGFVTGVAAKMFTIAGPIIVYGTCTSIICGLLYYFYAM